MLDVFCFVRGGVGHASPVRRHSDLYYIGGKAKSGFDFDALVAELRAVFPDSSTISDDYYAARLARSLEIAGENGMPPDSAPIECLKRVAAEHGLQRHVTIVVVESLIFDSRIDKSGVFMITCDTCTESDAEPLLAVLRRHPLEVQTF